MFASTLITCEAALDQPVKEVPEPSPGNSIVKPTATAAFVPRIWFSFLILTESAHGSHDIHAACRPEALR